MEVEGYYRLPVLVEAIQFTGEMENRNKILAWIGTCGGEATFMPARKAWVSEDGLSGYPEMAEHIRIITTDSLNRAFVGDWIIRGRYGTFYTCPDEAFRISYKGRHKPEEQE